MTKLRSLLYIVAFFALGSCNTSGDKSQQAAASAKEAYQYIMDGKYESFVHSTVGYDSIPEAYREQVVTSMKQYATSLKKAHGGMSAVDIINAEAIDSLHTAQVLLLLHFTDSTTEQVSVQMVERNGKWLLK